MWKNIISVDWFCRSKEICSQKQKKWFYKMTMNTNYTSYLPPPHSMNLTWNQIKQLVFYRNRYIFPATNPSPGPICVGGMNGILTQIVFNTPHRFGRVGSLKSYCSACGREIFLHCITFLIYPDSIKFQAVGWQPSTARAIKYQGCGIREKLPDSRR